MINGQDSINTEDLHNLHVQEIYEEHKRIDGDWLMLHYKVSIGVVIFAFLVECIMGAILVNSDLLTTTTGIYILKYIVIPSGINFLCIAANTAAMKSRYFSQEQKIYVISLSIVAVSFILFTVHTIFWATYSIFVGAIMMTVIYANYRLTGITSLTSIILIAFSEVFIKWDIEKETIFDSTLRMGDFLISLFIIVALSTACMVAIQFERKKNNASIQRQIESFKLRQSLRTDEMTGIYNRKMLHDVLKGIEEDGSYDRYIMAMVDIDHFKEINDNFGHHFGDRCIAAFAKILKQNESRAMPFRYGGDEFCLLFRDVSMEEAVDICESIQVQLKTLRFEDNPMVELTASFGLAAHSVQLDAVRLFVRSDYALYEAKKSRNTIHVFYKDFKLAE